VADAHAGTKGGANGKPVGFRTIVFFSFYRGVAVFGGLILGANRVGKGIRRNSVMLVKGIVDQASGGDSGQTQAEGVAQSRIELGALLDQDGRQPWLTGPNIAGPV